ncbi:2-isopropylmalate synthase [Ferrimonas balearica]|uniref:2-isopropylmalate synthase n=1 Tax=Ferrimonas balearica TaxID=44012 RepID=UPI001C98A03F|nr:2-isopropylmalate synthase [Ferrimonas balearica]MBY5982183.1 2-isopropylmalate synthase [Ferrimonas balearica]
MSDRVILFDTTLRDGEQALAASLSVNEKLQIARALERTGIDIIEAGFPVSSPGDFDSVQQIARTLRDSRVCALSRAVQGDIDAAAEAMKVADQFRIHTFISTSSIHVESKLKRNFDQVLEMATGAVRYARRFTDDVEFSCEDAGRTPIDNLCRMVEAAIKAGATTVNIPDTVGYTTPTEFGGIITNLFERVPNIHQAVISVHCHDDLGLSVANSIAAIEAGARQVEGTINGIGERAGNAALEEVIMILNTRQAHFGLTTNARPTEIYRTSSQVSRLCNMPIQPNKAIVGSNAFSHSSGIHQDGMLKAQNTYEIMTPESVGLPRNTLNLTSRSGRHVIKHRMTELGYQEQDFDLDTLYQRFLELADKKGQVFDYDLEALLFFENQKEDDAHYVLRQLNVQAGSNHFATGSIEIGIGQQVVTEAATGNGPVDSVYRAIERATGQKIAIQSFDIGATGEGHDALGQVDITAEYQGRTFHGMGLSTDIIEASARALIHVYNLIHRQQRIDQQKQDKAMGDA